MPAVHSLPILPALHVTPTRKRNPPRPVVAYSEHELLAELPITQQDKLLAKIRAKRPRVIEHHIDSTSEDSDDEWSPSTSPASPSSPPPSPAVHVLPELPPDTSVDTSYLQLSPASRSKLAYNPREHVHSFKCPAADCLVISDKPIHRVCHQRYCNQPNDTPWTTCKRCKDAERRYVARHRQVINARARRRRRVPLTTTHAYRATTHGRFMTLVAGARRSQRRRGHDMQLFHPTEARLQAIYDRNDKCCEYSGYPMNVEAVPGESWPPSIERYDPITTRGYCEGNYTLVCLEFNGVTQWSPAKFKQLVADIEQHADGPDVTEACMRRWLRRLLKHTTSRAKKLSKEMTLTEDALYDLVQQQQGKCEYSNHYMTFARGKWQCSVERLDQARGYTLDNVALICWEFNTGKVQWSRQKFCTVYPYIRAKHQ